MAIQEYGGPGGTAFAAQTINSIALRGGFYVDAIIINGQQFGGDGGGLGETLTLGDGEYINEVRVRHDQVIHQLDISTNLGRRLSAGGASQGNDPGGTGGVTRILRGRINKIGGQRDTYLDRILFDYEPDTAVSQSFGAGDGGAFPKAGIHSIKLFAGAQYLEAIEINGNHYGGSSGSPTAKLILENGEYIQAMAVRHGQWIDRVDVFTNRGRHIGAGGSGGGLTELYGKVTAIGGHTDYGLVTGLDITHEPDGRITHTLGGSGGGTFEPRDISSIGVRSGSYMDGIVVNGQTFGGGGGGLQELTLAAGEYVNRVRVWEGTILAPPQNAAEPRLVHRLEFFTNHFRFVKGGSAAGAAMNHHEVRGRLKLIGGRSGGRLDQLKLVMVPDEEPVTHWFGGTGGGLSVHRDIQSIALRSGNEVDGIIVDGQAYGGAGGGLSNTLTLADGEYINCVTVRHDHRIRRVDFYTNRGNHLGGGGGGHGHTEQTVVGRLEAMAVYAGDWVDGLALRMISEDSERVMTRGTLPSDGPERFEYTRIESIAIRSGNVVDGIVINGNLHGAGGGGLSPTLQLVDGEYIDKVVLRHDNHQTNRLEIYTNLGRSISGGGNGGWPTTIEGRVVGIAGHEGHFLPALSFKVSSEQSRRFGYFQVPTFAPAPIRQSIALRRGDRIDGLVIDGTLYGTESGGLTETLTLQGDEYIRKAVVYGDQWFIHRLELYTSQGRSLMAGNAQGLTPQVVTGRIVAIGGAAHENFNGIVFSVLPDPIRVQTYGGPGGAGFPMQPFDKIALRHGSRVDAIELDDVRFGGGGGGAAGPLDMAPGEFVDELHIRSGQEVDWLKVKTTQGRELQGGGGGGGYDVFRGEIVALGGSAGSVLDRLVVMGRPTVPDASPPMVSTTKTSFAGSSRSILFDKNGCAALAYRSVFGHRWKHLQDMIRLPDHNGKRYYMGTWSGGSLIGGARGAVFVAELDPAQNQNHGRVIWCDVLNNRHPAGGFNHPGDLRRIGDTVIIAGQNWPGNWFAQRLDPMPLGNGGNAVLFYDVRTPSRPIYTGKVDSCWEGSRRRTTGEVDSITAVKADGRYCLAFSGLKCHAPAFSPHVPWEFISTGDLGSPSPVLVNHNGVDVPCVVDVQSNGDVQFKRVVFDSGTLGSGTTSVTTQPLLTTSGAAIPNLGGGMTSSVNTLANGDTVLIFANVHSDADIQIGEVLCT